jgi:hypothetical protein
VVPCRGIRAQGYLALGLDCGSEGGVVFFTWISLCTVVSDLRGAICVPAHFGPCYFLFLNIMMCNSPACSRKKCTK